MSTSKLNDKVIKLDFSFFPTPWSKSNWKKHLENANCRVTYFEVEKKLIGFSAWEYLSLEEITHLHKIFILEIEREKGMGRKFLNETISHMKTDFPQVKGCFLEVEQTNYPACKLYKSEGFDILGESKHFYGAGRHAFRMMKSL